MFAFTFSMQIQNQKSFEIKNSYPKFVQNKRLRISNSNLHFCLFYNQVNPSIRSNQRIKT